MQKNGTLDAQIQKRRPHFVANYPQKWWKRLLFHMNIIFGRMPTKRSEKINKPSWLSKYYLYPCKNVWNTFELWIWFKHSSGAHIFHNFVNSGEVSSPQDTFEHLPKILLFLRPCPSILLKLLQTFQNRFWTSCPNVHHFFCKRPGLFLVCS